MKIILQSDRDMIGQVRAAEYVLRNGSSHDVSIIVIGDRSYAVMRRKTCLSVYTEEHFNGADFGPKKGNTAQDPASRRPHAARARSKGFPTRPRPSTKPPPSE
jgi:hypothetical protein